MALNATEVREIIDRHRWRDGERDQTMADLAERLAERENSGHDAPSYIDVVRKARPLATAQPDAVKPMTQPTDDWVRYAKRQLDSRERLMADCVGDAREHSEKIQGGGR
jgi:hypothetical protein